jgi:hypothetical protein
VTGVALPNARLYRVSTVRPDPSKLIRPPNSLRRVFRVLGDSDASASLHHLFALFFRDGAVIQSVCRQWTSSARRDDHRQNWRIVAAEIAGWIDQIFTFNFFWLDLYISNRLATAVVVTIEAYFALFGESYERSVSEGSALHRPAKNPSLTGWDLLAALRIGRNEIVLDWTKR